MDVKKCLDSYPEILEYLDGVPIGEIIKYSKIVKYKQNVRVLQKGYRFDNIGIVFMGIVKVVNEFDNGTNYAHKKLYPMTILGDIEVVSNNLESAATVFTSTETYSLEIPIDVFVSWLDAYPVFTRSVAKYLAIRFYENTKDIGNDLVFSSKYNMANVIIRLVDSYLEDKKISNGEDFEIVIRETRKQLAEMLAVTERTVNRNLLFLKTENYISIVDRKITINREQYGLLKENLLIF